MRAPTAKPRTKVDVVRRAVVWVMANSALSCSVPCENPDDAIDTMKQANARSMALNHLRPVPKLSGFSASPSSQSTGYGSFFPSSNSSTSNSPLHRSDPLDCHDGRLSTSNSPAHTRSFTSVPATGASHVCLCALFPTQAECRFRD